MTQQLKQPLHHRKQGQRMLLIWYCFQLMFVLGAATEARAQSVNLVGACPTQCGIQIRITSAKLRERADGIEAVINWTLEQRAPEIKLKSLLVTATVEFNRLGKDEQTISVPPNQRQAVIRLQSGGFNKDIKFSDVTSIKAKVFATADPLPALNVTDIRSLNFVGQGGDSALDVSWRVPTPLACSASQFVVKVKAVNEKGDLLNGEGEAAPTARSLRVQLKGDLNKKGLRSPEATVKLEHSLVGCEQTTSFAPALEPFGSGTGSNAPNPVVTLKPITITFSGSRFDTDIAWDVVEPSGFKATKFDLKFETELANGNVFPSNQTVAGNVRNLRGPQAQTGDRSITVTIKATFTAGATVLTREDKRTQPFTAKIIPAKPVAPQPQNIGLNVTSVKLSNKAGGHSVLAAWQVNVPASITVTSFEVEAIATGNQKSATRNTIVLGQVRQATINFAVDEIGNQLRSAQIKVIVNGRRADGSTFQQTATRNSN